MLSIGPYDLDSAGNVPYSGYTLTNAQFTALVTVAWRRHDVVCGVELESRTFPRCGTLCTEIQDVLRRVSASPCEPLGYLG